MIKFRSIVWQNFLSTGNTPTKIQLDRNPTTLIVGHNGAGKSTLLDAIAFVLFGKPHRDINKPALLNSVNKKNCLVTVDFSIGSHEFSVKRGIKPNIFEIWQNGHMINQSSTSRDYQKFLEQNILKLNHKSFHQIVVLGSSSFIPFMQLKASHRREVIEDLLDINIFSKMNLLLKENVAKLKDTSKQITSTADLFKEKINMQKGYIKNISEAQQDNIGHYEESNKELYIEREELTSELDNIDQSLVAKRGRLDDELKDLNSRRKKFESFKTTFNTKIKALVKETKFYEENDSCPTCDQNIGGLLKEKKKSGAAKKVRGLEKGMIEADSEIQGVDLEIVAVQGSIDQIITTGQRIADIAKDIAKIDVLISRNLKRIEKINNEDNCDIQEANSKLGDLVEEFSTLSTRKAEIADNLVYHMACTEMFKDTGIKTKIIKEYLPVMNNLINQYLQTLDFFVSFHLDESFNESIRSRHRDDFQYASFSEGEKQRIDLALLFTWRQIAKMKNSTNTNLLILDETFDSSMDQDGVDNLMRILDTLDQNTNVFVISHKGDILDGKFRSKIEFNKDKNFSKIKA